MMCKRVFLKESQEDETFWLEAGGEEETERK